MLDYKFILKTILDNPKLHLYVDAKANPDVKINANPHNVTDADADVETPGDVYSNDNAHAKHQR